MLNLLAASGMIVSLLATVPMLNPSAEEELAAPEGVSVEVVTVNGSGCPAGQGTATMAADGNSFTLSSPGYFAWAGGDAGPTDFRRNCQVAVHVARPEGYTYAVAQVRASGFAYLAEGATGVTRTSLYFQGTSPTTAVSRTFTGPLARRWTTTDVVDAADLRFAPCGADRYLNINTELRVSAGSSDPATDNLMFRDTESSYRLIWRRCA
jgi:hypothetical protein